MKIRDKVRAVVRERPGCTLDAVTEQSGVPRKDARDALYALVAVGEFERVDGGYRVNADYVPKPTGAAAHRLKRLPKKVRGFRAEARARGVKRPRGRPPGNGKAKSVLDGAARAIDLSSVAAVLHKHAWASAAAAGGVAGAPNLTFRVRGRSFPQAPDTTENPSSSLARATFAVVVALLPEADGAERSALRYAMDAHARALAALA